MSDKPFRDPWHPEQDRLWAAHDETNKAMQALEARVLTLETDPRQQRIDKLTVDIERPTRQVGDYMPDPSGMDKAFGAIPDMPLDVPDTHWLLPEDRLAIVAGILSEMLPPSGTPSPAQRLLLRIKAVVR